MQASHSAAWMNPTVDNKKINILLSCLLALTCIVLYSNTYYNNYCLDDVMVITENTVTQKGFSGINEHLSHEYLYGYLKDASQSATSPWRPLPLITYSIEIGLFGSNHPGISHLANLLLYLLTTILLFKLLQKYFLKDTWLAFFSALLFAIHPIHTEVVANIKSRDEILCLFFLMSTLYFLWHHSINEKKYSLLFSIVCFFMALLSKETAVTFVVGIPVLLYFFTEKSTKKILVLSSYFLGVSILYFLVRNAVIPFSTLNPSDTNGSLIILNYPYLYAQGSEAFFTKIFILLKYLKLLIVPYPLCFDYSYNQIPYTNASDIFVWISFLVYGAMLVYAIKNFKKKDVLSCCILLYLITFSLASNLFINVAVTIGERLLYIPSVFFCIALAFIGKKIINYSWLQFKISRIITLALFLLPIILFCSYTVIDRNKDWKDTDTLNLTDYPKAPNSIRLNDGVGNYYLKVSERASTNKTDKIIFIKKAMSCYSKALELFPEFDNDLINMGVSYDRLGNITQAEYYWNRLREVSPSHPKLVEYDKYLARYYMTKGVEATQKKAYDSSEIFLLKATKYATANDSITADAWYHLAGMYYETSRIQQSYDALSKVLAIEPGNVTARMGYNSCAAILNSKKDTK
jgi:tetratricopeptide (TPR) repeat protein